MSDKREYHKRSANDIKHRCSRCKRKRLSKHFYKDKRSKSGLSYWCKECNREIASAISRQTTVDPEKRIKRICKRYNITVEEYNEVLRHQHNRCYVCFRKVKLGVDHNHDTGQFRGLLCHNCNTAIGLLDDSLWRMRRMIEYMEVNDRVALMKEREIWFALLGLFTMLDQVFTEDDALSKAKRRMSLGRCYEEWKRCRAKLDPTFNPKSHDRTMKYGSMPIKGGLSRDA